MKPDSKKFPDGHAAPGTRLRRPVRRYFLVPAPGAFNLGSEYVEKHSPSCIRYAARQVAVLDHIFDVQAFNGKPVITFHQRTCDLMDGFTVLRTPCDVIVDIIVPPRRPLPFRGGDERRPSLLIYAAS